MRTDPRLPIEGHSPPSPGYYVFDAYGTLLDVDSAVQRCDPEGVLPDGFAARWRAKQLEYTWTLQAMGAYRDFAAVTADALEYVIAATGADAALREPLLEAYDCLDCFPEVDAVLRALQAAGARHAVLSNGTAPMLARALGAAGIDTLFEATISVDEIGVYKPDPRVYRHAVQRLATSASQIHFVSSNAWDAAGAGRCGLRVTWVNRHAAPEEYRLADHSSSIEDLRGLLPTGAGQALNV
jgi:2-haloacid dehalogenase